MRHTVCVFSCVLVSISAFAQAQDDARRKIESQLASQSWSVFCGKTLRDLARTPPEKRKQPYSDAVMHIASKSYGVGLDEYDNIKSKSFAIGTSECALAAALGRPDKGNRTTNAYGYRIQWVYRSQGLYVYTKNGKVTSWQD